MPEATLAYRKASDVAPESLRIAAILGVPISAAGAIIGFGLPGLEVFDVPSGTPATPAEAALLPAAPVGVNIATLALLIAALGVGIFSAYLVLGIVSTFQNRQKSVARLRRVAVWYLFVLGFFVIAAAYLIAQRSDGEVLGDIRWGLFQILGVGGYDVWLITYCITTFVVAAAAYSILLSIVVRLPTVVRFAKAPVKTSADQVAAVK